MAVNVSKIEVEIMQLTRSLCGVLSIVFVASGCIFGVEGNQTNDGGKDAGGSDARVTGSDVASDPDTRQSEDAPPTVADSSPSTMEDGNGQGTGDATPNDTDGTCKPGETKGGFQCRGTKCPDDCIETACDDGQDNDGDKRVDCNDRDCMSDSDACPEKGDDTKEDDCDDGKDNDRDGQTDCKDPGCHGHDCSRLVMGTSTCCSTPEQVTRRRCVVSQGTCSD